MIAGLGAHWDQGVEQEDQGEGCLQGVGSQAQAEEENTQEQELLNQVWLDQLLIPVLAHNTPYKRRN